MKRVFVIIVIAIFMSSGFARADEIPAFDKEAFIASSEIVKRLEVNLVDCVALALKSNKDILIKKITPQVEDANVLIQRARFEPNISFDFLMEDEKDISPSTLYGIATLKTRTGVFNFGYDQKFVTGTKLELDFYNTRTASNSVIQSKNPEFNSQAMATVRQPLLKGFGIIVNKADFLIAKNNKKKSMDEFSYEVMKIVTDVKKTYYDYQYSQEQYKVALASLKRVQNLYGINKEKYAKGLASNVDLLESEAEVARAEQSVYYALDIMRISEDNLKFVTGLVDEVELWNSDIALLEQLDFEKSDPKLAPSIIKAFDYRPDYRAARLNLKNKDISVTFYKNNMLPTLDLVGSYGLNGLAQNYEKDLGHIGGGKYPDWSIGVNFNLPLGSDKEKGEYDKSKLEKERALVEFKKLEQNIILEVRKAVRNIGIFYKTLEASIKAKDAETKNYEAQETRFRAGLVSTLDMLIYEEKLAKSELSYVRSVIDYKVALIELVKVQGLTLLSEGITIE